MEQVEAWFSTEALLKNNAEDGKNAAKKNGTTGSKRLILKQLQKEK